MSIFYENVDGISKHKMNDLLISTASADYHTIVASETWVDHTINSLEIVSNQYITYRKDRESTSITKKRGGWIFIAVTSDLKSEEYSNS